MSNWYYGGFNNSLKHYGVIGMRKGVRRVKTANSMDRFTESRGTLKSIRTVKPMARVNTVRTRQMPMVGTIYKLKSIQSLKSNPNESRFQELKSMKPTSSIKTRKKPMVKIHRLKSAFSSR